MGPGMLILNGNNAYSGGTSIGGGTLQMGSALALGSTNGSLAVNSPGALNLNGNSVTVGALTGSGTIDNTTGGGLCTLSVGAGDANGAFSGVIQNTAGTVALTKIGAGKLDLAGASAYSGPTKISGGTLELDGTESGAENLPTATALSIAAGAALDMGGNPQTVGSLSGAAGAIIMNNLVYSHTYRSTLTVNPTSGVTTFAGNIVELDAVERPRQRGVDDVRQRRIGPHRGEHVLRRDVGQQRRAGDRRGQRLARQRVGVDQRRRAAGFGERLWNWGVAFGLVAGRFGRGCLERRGGNAGDDRRI